MKIAMLLLTLGRPVSGFMAPTFLRNAARTLSASSGYDCLSPMPEPEKFDAIEALLIERSDARYARDYDRADDIRDQLKDEFSVAVYDRDNAWEIREDKGFRGGGGRGGRGRGGFDRPPVDFGPTGHDYVRNEKDTSDLSDERLDEINSLLAERLQAKLSRDFGTADAIQIKLQQELDVIVHDGYKEWRGDGTDFAFKTAYKRTGIDMDSPIDEEAVNQLIKQRAAARKNRDYTTADDIKAQIENEFNVHLNDAMRTWEVKVEGKVYGSANSQWKRGDEKGSDEADDFETTVQALVDEREKARAARDYDTADEIRDRLSDEFGVFLQNRERTWTVGPYVAKYKRDKFDRPSPDEDEDFASTVQAIVDERADAKANKDWDTADDLRDELNNDFNVYVDDRKMIWKIDNGPPPRRGGGRGRF